MVAPRPNPDGPRQIIAATLVVTAVIAGFAAAYLLSDVLFLLFIGVVLATALEPVIDGRPAPPLPQPFAVAAVYTSFIFVLAVVVIILAPFAIEQVRELLSSSRVRTSGAPMVGQRRGRPVGECRQANRGRVLSSKAPAEPEQTISTVGQTASYMATAARGLLVACGVVLLAFYWSLQGDRTIRWLLLLLPATSRDGCGTRLSRSRKGRCLRSRSRPGLPGHGGYGCGCVWLLGLRYAAVLGLAAGFMEVLPVFGPFSGPSRRWEWRFSRPPEKRPGSCWQRLSCSRSKTIFWFRG